MPRRMGKSHEDLRADAVVAARTMVRADGVAGLTVRRVAEAVGCSVGSVYNLFLDLDDIVLHLSAEVLDELMAAIFGAPLPAEAAARVVAMAERYVAFAAGEPELWSMLFEHNLANDRPVPDWHAERVARLVAAVRAGAADALGGRSDAETNAGVDVLWASVHGIAALGRRGKLGFVTGATAADMVRRLVAVYLAGRSALGAGETAAGERNRGRE